MAESLAGTGPKISRHFQTRLDALDVRRKVRAIVKLETGAVPRATRRSGSAGRKTAVAAMRETAESHFSAIDSILQRHHGKRLALHADALGCVPVEVTPAGIEALADSEHVQAIFEDQPISSLK